MGWLPNTFNQVRTAILTAAGSAADTVSGVLQGATDAAGDIAETPGGIIEDGLDLMSRLAGKTPWVGSFFGGLIDWSGRSTSGAFDLIGSVIKGISSFLTGVISGMIRILGGILGLKWALLLEGLIDIGSGTLGAIIVIGGKLISLFQTLTYFLQPNKRKLTTDEKRRLKHVFWDSLALYNVRLVNGFAGLFSVNSRPFALGNTIYMKNQDVSKNPDLLVHECIHVWQYQSIGARYTADALRTQWFGNAYDWQQDVEQGRTNWVHFNKEAQGKFHEDLYDKGELLHGVGVLKCKGAFYHADDQGKFGRFVLDNVNHTDRANDAVEALRSKKSYRLSRYFP